LNDDRLRAYVISVLGALGYDVSHQDRPTEPHTSLWVAEMHNGIAQEVERFVDEGSTRFALVFGDTPEGVELANERIALLARTPKPASIRQALRILLERKDSATQHNIK
jgi:hypothetical protein